jgi:hypothetical protein
MIDNKTAKALAEKLHRANSEVINAKRYAAAPGAVRTATATASGLIKDVIEALLDQPGQTDAFGNSTYRGEQK